MDLSLFKSKINFSNKLDQYIDSSTHNNFNKIKKLKIEKEYFYQIAISNCRNNKQEILYYKKFLKEYPNNFFVLNNFGNFYRSTGNVAKALNYYLRSKKKYKKIDKLKTKSDNLKKKIESVIKNKNSITNDFFSIQNEMIHLIIECQMLTLISKSRPHFAENFLKLKELILIMKKYLNIKLTKRTLLKFCKVLCFFKNLPSADYDNVFYNIGFCYQQIKKYNLAIKNYKLANKFENSNKYTYKILECLYLRKDKKNIIKLTKKMYKKKVDFNLLAVANHVSRQLNIKNFYPFCKNPIDNLVKFKLIDEKIVSYDFLKKVEKDISYKRKHVNTPKVLGFKSLGNLYELNTNSLNKCKKIILDCIKNYKKNFNDLNSILIKKWPKKFTINAWYIKLKKGGEVLPHIHDGWLSGVFYIKKKKKSIKQKLSNEGELEVSNKFMDLKEFIKSSKKTIYVNTGDLVLFPSSLPHRVIPYNSNYERLSIAFDMKPVL